MLKCNIDGNTNHLHEGLALGLKDDREKMSEALGRTAMFRGTSVITSLPEFLTVQMVRFFYKTDTQTKAKVLRKVRGRSCMGEPKAKGGLLTQGRGSAADVQP